jgi:hypothetical protein
MEIFISVHKDGRICLIPQIDPPAANTKARPMHPSVTIRPGESAFGYTYDDLVGKNESVVTANA